MPRFPFPDWQPERWEDLAENPLIAPVSGTSPGCAIGDPQVILPGEYDDAWHMFLIGEGHFFRFDSRNGIHWDLAYDYNWSSGPMCVTTDGNRWYVYYTHVARERCIISIRKSDDLTDWSEPETVLEPELKWELEGERVQVRNPCVVQLADGGYRMYYSGGTIWLGDCGYEEPKHIGCAESPSPAGPFEKRPEPILGPEEDVPYRSFGAGAIKVFRYGRLFLGLANGLYRDAEGHSRSAIDLLLSEDGIEWEDAPYNPVISPGNGWKEALVYQLDLRWREGKLWLFYNARDGWRSGVEWIGCSTLDWQGERPEKMWDLR